MKGSRWSSHAPLISPDDRRMVEARASRDLRRISLGLQMRIGVPTPATPCSRSVGKGVAMRLNHRGVTIELPEDDRRVPIIEALIFGGPLPEPERLPEGGLRASGAGEAEAVTTSPQPEPASTRTAEADIPEPWRRVWRSLSPLTKRWLSRLLAGPVTVREVPRALAPGRGRQSMPLSGVHLQLRNACDLWQVKWPIVARGRAQQRRYMLAPDAEDFVRILVEHDAVHSTAASPGPGKPMRSR